MSVLAAVPKTNKVASVASEAIYVLNEGESRCLEGLLRNEDPYNIILEEYFRNAELAFGSFPLALRYRIIEFRDCGNAEGFLLIRGMPRDPIVPPTPVKSETYPMRATYYAEFLMACISRALGQPVGYLQEKAGRIFQGIYPTSDHAYKQTSASSSVLLKFHTEVCFHRHLPDHLLLYGLRQDREALAKTIVSSIQRVLSHLTLDQRRRLSEPQFKTKVDLSYGGGEGPTIPILSGDPSQPHFRFDDDFMEASTPEGQRALEALRNAVNAEKREIAIEPGDLIIIDNKMAVHARSEFQPHYDGSDRWLIRLLTVRDLCLSLGDRLPGTRVIATDSFATL